MFLDANQRSWQAARASFPAVHPLSVISAPAIDEVDAIAAMDNPVLRKLQITQCYAELSAAMRAPDGHFRRLVHFATWASPLGSISRWLVRKRLFQPDTRLSRVVAEIHTPFDAFERASGEVAIGNLKVFAEMADSSQRINRARQRLAEEKAKKR